MTDIADLIKRVEGLDGPNFDVELRVHAFMRPDHPESIGPAYTASVDAVISLIGERIGKDEAEWYVGRPTVDGPYRAGVRGHTGGLTDDVTGEAATPALALLLAFLRAWEAKGDG